VLLSRNRSDRKTQAGGSAHNSEKVNVNKFSGKCFNCGKNSHISRFCKSKRRQNESSDVNDAMIAIACNAELMNNNKMWVMDSGATKYMCTKQKALTNLNKDRQSTIYTAVKYSTKSIGVSEVILNARLNKHEKNPVQLKDMYIYKMIFYP